MVLSLFIVRGLVAEQTARDDQSCNGYKYRELNNQLWEVFLGSFWKSTLPTPGSVFVQVHLNMNILGLEGLGVFLG